jgi:hypothetical protein
MSSKLDEFLLAKTELVLDDRSARVFTEELARRN